MKQEDIKWLTNIWDYFCFVIVLSKTEMWFLQIRYLFTVINHCYNEPQETESYSWLRTWELSIWDTIKKRVKVKMENTFVGIQKWNKSEGEKTNKSPKDSH